MDLASKTTASQNVVFKIFNQLFALSIDEVLEILRFQTITPVPGIREHIEGAINLRGKIIPIVNLYKRFHLEVQEQSGSKKRIIIVEGLGEPIGIMVDEVMMVTYIEDTNIEKFPSMNVEEDCLKAIAKLDDQVIGILEVKKVLYPEN